MPEARRKTEDWLRRAQEAQAAQDLPAAFEAYQTALTLDPDSLDIVYRLADLAFQLAQWDMAEKLYAHLMSRGAQDMAVFSGYASALREQGKYDDAIAVLKPLLGQYPHEAALWEALGSVMLSQGDRETALIFLDEALRLSPDHQNALFLRGCARIEKNDLLGGLGDISDCARRFRNDTNRLNAELICANVSLALGDLTAGWSLYDARHMRGSPREVHYALNIPRRIQGQPIAGKNLFISAEQGLGDEVLYGSLLPDLIAELGDGRLGIGVEPRLASLFQRSFPAAMVVPHHTQTRNGRIYRDFPGLDAKAFDLWALMGDFLSSHRGRIADFPDRPAFLTPDPERVSYWRGYFNALNAKPKAGILWKSLKSSAVRNLAFSPFAQWHDILTTPGIQFINLQYGDASAELAAARAAGLDIHTPDGIDLKQDLDDLAALCIALDVVIGPSNATTNIAAACGAKVWMIAPPRTWLALGQSHYPWYPTVQLFMAPSLDDWMPAIKSVAFSLRELSQTNT